MGDDGSGRYKCGIRSGYKCVMFGVVVISVMFGGVVISV